MSGVETASSPAEYFARVEYPRYAAGGAERQKFLDEFATLGVTSELIESVIAGVSNKIEKELEGNRICGSQAGYPITGAEEAKTRRAAEARFLWRDLHFVRLARTAVRKKFEEYAAGGGKIRLHDADADGSATAAAHYSKYDADYAALVSLVLTNGRKKPSRQGGHVWSAVGKSICVSLRKDSGAPVIPVLHCKYVSLQTVAAELAWFLSGETNSRDLERRGAKIWQSDAAKFGWRRAVAGLPRLPAGELGPVYGHQWRKRAGGDQVARAVDLLVNDPYSRRILVDSWDPDAIGDMAVPPCHYAFQFVCEPGAALPCVTTTVHCVVSMRSTDVGLGLPFNVASYAMLTHIMCAEANSVVGGGRYVPGTLTVNMADCHVYEVHAGPLLSAVNGVHNYVAAAQAELPVRGADLQSPEAFTIDRVCATEAGELCRQHFATPDWGDWRPPRVRLPLVT